MTIPFRIGVGFDAHAFALDRPLILAGVKLRDHDGLTGHSDADVVIHVIIDALLGAANLGDIGRSFPDTDPAYRNIDSRELLRLSLAKLKSSGWRVGNVDVSVIAERPKIAPHAEAMCRELAPLLGVSTDAVSIKGTTTEKLGFAGREEGIAAMAVALIVRVE